MTQEQKRLFEKKVWDYHITENTTEYEIAKVYFKLGFKVSKKPKKDVPYVKIHM